MILKLRKRHRYTWIALSIILPVGFVLALANRPGPILPNEQMIEQAIPGFNERQPVAAAKTEGWSIEAYRAPDGQTWLEAKFREASQRPVSVLYLSPRAGAGIDVARAVGPVGPRGIYQYPLDSTTASWKEYHVFFYDQVRKEIYSETLLKRSR